MASAESNNGIDIQSFRQRSFDALVINSKFTDVAFRLKSDNDPTSTQLVYFVRGLLAAHTPELESILYNDNNKNTKITNDSETSSNDNVESLSLDPADCNDTTDEIIDMTHIHPLAFKWFLQFVYGLQPHINSNNVVPLFHFAKKYNINQIQQACVTIIVNAPYETMPTNDYENDNSFYFVAILESLVAAGLKDEIPSILEKMKQNNDIDSVINDKIFKEFLLSDFYLQLDESTLEQWFFKILKMHELISIENLFLAIKHWCKFNIKAKLGISTHATNCKKTVAAWVEPMKICSLTKYINFENIDFRFYKTCIEGLKPSLLTKEKKQKIIEKNKADEKEQDSKDGELNQMNVNLVDALNLVNFELSMLPKFAQGCCNTGNNQSDPQTRLYKQYYCCLRMNELLAITDLQPDAMFSNVCDKVVDTGIVPQIISFLTVKSGDERAKFSKDYLILEKLLQFEAISLLSSLGM